MAFVYDFAVQALIVETSGEGQIFLVESGQMVSITRRKKLFAKLNSGYFSLSGVFKITSFDIDILM